ncbi:MAG: hypothetical protein L0287_34595 [Anaerolineae bacterium]|nr:hypothetical protein [Anaerolineae bacterium]
MKAGKCPKYNSATVYTKRHGVSFASDTFFYVRISSERMSRSLKDVDHYICTTCGYVEIYIEDQAKLEAVTKDWLKVD